MSWMNARQYQQWYPTAGAPPGTWPPTAPAGYPGPPPAPAGVNPQAWTAGRWQVNPMYRGPLAGTQAAVSVWAPHPSWGPHIANASAAAVANYNPYKRTPNRGDAEYWRTKLSDNPLGLENMHIRDQDHRKTNDNGVVHTPWVWVPRELRESPERPPSSDRRSGQEGTSNQHRRDQPAVPQSHISEQSTPERSSQSRSSRDARSSYDMVTLPAATAPSHLQERPHDSHHYLNDARPSQNHASYEDNVIPPRDAISDPVIPPRLPPPISSSSFYSQQQEQERHHHRHQRINDVSPRDARPLQPQPRDDRTSPNDYTSSASSAVVASIVSVNGPTTPPRTAPTEAFSSSQELRPTFSPTIIRVPGHYSEAGTPPRRMSSDDAPTYRLSHSATPTRRMSSDDAHTSRASYSHSSSRHIVSDDAQSPHVSTPPRHTSDDDAHASRSSSTSLRTSIHDTNTPTSTSGHRISHYETHRASTNSSPTPRTRGLIYGPPTNHSHSNSVPQWQSTPSADAQSGATASRSSILSLTNFFEEPAGLLSPLITAPRSTGGPNSNGRRVIRSQTDPSSPLPALESIPEDRTTPGSRNTHQRNDSRDSNATPHVTTRTSPHSSTPPEAGSRSISRSQTYPSLDLSSSRHSSKQGSPVIASKSRELSPTRTVRASHNPLPQPPMLTAYPTSSASSSAAAMSTQPVVRRKVRKGYWNRRGDHLTMEPDGQYIVYAPQQLANPHDLSRYPQATQGFMDHRGRTVKYDPRIPELPASLPLHGEPPARPYEEFVEYIYV
ncbi:uncharacterized protein LAESUDRAFT_711585 [Laetiporus sulphureus 93-53]|uniref:Uncharacterized protein n=1 Tax=Laetiporus sulphureus 93-53 TaxID=1314785 RepID=A0A165GIF1_9APHY|nr:uncharacterized protein LAESUDRAFT_711585 [Laetiporus sulphureus 93-53]KZT10392.1 hypothetical protein LAESUDRAFT_711585 [Laetiporus sulphureus 93-53]